MFPHTGGTSGNIKYLLMFTLSGKDFANTPFPYRFVDL